MTKCASIRKTLSMLHYSEGILSKAQSPLIQINTHCSIPILAKSAISQLPPSTRVEANNRYFKKPSPKLKTRYKLFPRARPKKLCFLPK